MNSSLNGLSSLLTPQRYQASREHCFPSATSLTWFIRSHRARLVRAGALVQVAGRNLVHEEKLDAEVLAIGQQSLAEAA